MDVPGNLVGAWSSPGPTAVLLCRPNLTITAAGPGHALWTSGNTRFTAPYGTYDATLSVQEVIALVGSDGIASGQTITVAIPKAGYASYRFRLTLNYSVEGTGKTGSATAEFACEAP